MKTENAPRRLTPQEHRDLELEGARVQIGRLHAEFPELAQDSRIASPDTPATIPNGNGQAKRRQMSPAARKAQSKRMRAWWAGKKKTS